MKFIEPEWPAPTHIKAYTTVRQVWGNREPHHDINRGNYSAENAEYQTESQNLKNLLQLPAEPIWITQTHSTVAIPALPENKEHHADASFSNQPNHICVVLTADCLPILVCNKQGSYVAAIHAGWKGLANGIIEATLKAMEQPAEELLVWLGPAIGPDKFEVGEDVYHAFISKHSDEAIAFSPQSNEKWLADLYLLARLRLQKQGVASVYGGNFCTYSQEDLFFSYRRDKGHTGRMASLIWIQEKKW